MLNVISYIKFTLPIKNANKFWKISFTYYTHENIKQISIIK